MIADWEERFLDAARRRGLKPTTVAFYGRTLRQISNHHALDLETCPPELLLEKFSRMRDEYELSTYGTFVVIAKAALNFLGRKDLSEQIEQPRRVNRATMKEPKLHSETLGDLPMMHSSFFRSGAT